MTTGKIVALAALGLALVAPAALAGPPHPSLPGRARIGVQVQTMTPELRQHFEAPPDRGLLVTRVEPGQPAAAAGIEVGDVLLQAGETALRGSYDLVRAVGRAPEGEKLELVVLRKDKTRTVAVVPRGTAAPWPDPEGWAEWLEEGVQRGSREMRERMRELEKRLEELEKRLEEEREIRNGAERT